MATAYSRELPSGKVTWHTKVKQPDGTWKSVQLRGVKNKSQANKLAFEIEQEQERLHHGLEVGALFRGTFAELCHWAYGVHFKHLGGAASDRYRICQHAGDLEAKPPRMTWLGALEAREVTSAQLTKYFSELADTITVRGKPTSAGSINRIRATFSVVFSTAIEHGIWSGDNPAEKTSARKVPKRGHDILAVHEIGPVLAALSDYWRGVFAVALLAGLRRGEIFALQKKDVNLERREFLVGRSHDRDTTKGGTSAPVPIHEQLVEYVRPWLASPGPLLFPDPRGKMRSRHLHLEKILRAAMVRAGIVEHYVHKCRRKGCGHKEQQPDAERRVCPSCQMKLWPVGVARLIRFHDTRHTLGSHAIMSGASLASVQKILRHQDPRLTANTYAHLSAGYLGDELNRITLPGLVSTAARRPSPPTASETSEPKASESIDSRGLADGHGAPLVHGLDGVHQGAIVESMIQHENGFGSEWSRPGLNRRPMHCEWDAVASGWSPPLEQASQTLGNAHLGPGTVSTRLLAVAPLPGGHGAPVVHGAGFVHQAVRSAKHEGPGRFPTGRAAVGHGPSEDVLLTVRQVAERLHLSTGWVYRRIDSGELGHVRVGDNAIRVSAADLDRYLRRFPGIEAPTAPAAARGEASRRRKDGAA